MDARRVCLQRFSCRRVPAAGLLPFLTLAVHTTHCASREAAAATSKQLNHPAYLSRLHFALRGSRLLLYHTFPYRRILFSQQLRLSCSAFLVHSLEACTYHQLSSIDSPSIVTTDSDCSSYDCTASIVLNSS